ncbi:glycosyl hydrolase 2 galactose-binding domain-containing protein [Vibrio pectenicida]|uniref:Beta-mannosidase-like galactose-binding domain-containing protein n=1 Tax=Vibrio pectenicida TaxID=62763 RepID=A0A3R9FA81_9VIBR|nr:hypothetical protein [Vibrio pectenicida]RSD32398.1 hypothetical protein EJA03_03935 [Vibrio pectenicida]
MQLSLAGLWQLSPLTDLSILQDDIRFPAPLSDKLPSSLSEEQIVEQEWHLMHDIEVNEVMMAYPSVDLVLGGIDYHAEVRLNGIALFDCDGSQAEYKKDIRPHMQLGRNRFEILLIKEDDDLLFEEDKLDICSLGEKAYQKFDSRVGIWKEPYLQFIRHVRLEHVVTEQIWHHGGGCEFMVVLHYKTYSPGLLSALVKFNGMTYQLPIDVRNNHVSALFQVEAPIYFNAHHPDPNDLYPLEVTLDGQTKKLSIGLSDDLCVTHFPI